MDALRQLNWPLIVVLGIVALARPLARIVFAESSLPTPVIALGMTGIVTLVWALGLGLSRSPNPLLGGVFTGLVYAVGAILLSAVLSSALHGRLEGPVADPIAIVPMLLINAVWGAFAGALALVIRRLRWGAWELQRIG